MPNVTRIFVDGAVCGKAAGAGNVHQRFAVPVGAVGVSANRFLLGAAIIGEIRKHHIGVVVQKRAADFRELLAGDADAVDEINRVVQLGVVVVIILRVIAAAFELFDFGGLHTENEDVVFAHRVENLDVRAVHGAQGNCAVEHQFHIARAARFGAGERNLFGNIRRGHQVFRHGDVVVFTIDHFQASAHIGVVVNQVAQSADKADNLFRHEIARRCFRTENIGVRRDFGVGIRLNREVFGQNVQSV